MKIPYARKAVIPKIKLTDYLLSESHTVGKLKAKFFREIGYKEDNTDKLEKALLSIVQKGEIQETIVTPYGKKYVVDKQIQTPTGKIVKLRTVWIIEQNQKNPRFVTAYPV